MKRKTSLILFAVLALALVTFACSSPPRASPPTPPIEQTSQLQIEPSPYPERTPSPLPPPIGQALQSQPKLQKLPPGLLPGQPREFLASAVPTPTRLDAYLCCGTTPGETGTIWSVRYPAEWQVSLLPNNPYEFFGALFSEPDGQAVITIIPGSNTAPGEWTDTGDVDEFLDRFVLIRQQDQGDYEEFMRQPVAGIPRGRLWAGTWGSGSNRGWESYLVVVDPLLQVAPGLPRGYLTMFGARAASRDWNNALQTYETMLKSMLVKRYGGYPEGLPMKDTTAKPFLVRWCPTTCDWMAVDADSDNWVGNCGKPTLLWEGVCEK